MGRRDWVENRRIAINYTSVLSKGTKSWPIVMNLINGNPDFVLFMENILLVLSKNIKMKREDCTELTGLLIFLQLVALGMKMGNDMELM
jgi:hypothetical protein